MRATIVAILVFTGFQAVYGAELKELFEGTTIKDPLHLELQRPVDARLAKLEAQGVDGCGLFKGEIHIARSSKEVGALSDKLKPGDQLVLGGTDWKDAHFTFYGHGTDTAPILVRPESPGSVVFTGASEVIFSGAHLIITGLKFKEVAPAKKGAVLFRLGNGKAQPAANCIVDHITMDHCGSPLAEDWPRLQMWLMYVRGKDNTVANCSFLGLKNIGQMLGSADLPEEGLQRLHILNNRFMDRPKIDNQNGYEIIQIGWSGENGKAAGSLIQGNTFANCDGENEVITLKASDIVVRKNHFNGCQGVLSLRSGNRVLVQDNVFDGMGRTNTGGITLCGAGHVIVGNTLQNLRKPANYYFWAIAMMSASAETQAADPPGYARAANIVIARNRFEACDARIAVGVYPRPEYPLLPQNIWVRDNTFKGTAATEVFDYVAPDPKGDLAKTLHEAGNRFQP